VTKTFERFLRSFSDEELVAFAQDRGRAQPPYWKVMRLALKVEASRRGLQNEQDPAEPLGATAEPEARTGTV